MKINKTMHIEMFQRVEEFSTWNTSITTSLVRQSAIDREFESSATPVFIAMLSLSIATFIAAFFQVLKIYSIYNLRLKYPCSMPLQYDLQ